MVHCSESGIVISTSELISVALGACLFFFVLFLREDFDHFVFFLPRAFMGGEFGLAAIECFCGCCAVARL